MEMISKEKLGGFWMSLSLIIPPMEGTRGYQTHLRAKYGLASPVCPLEHIDYLHPKREQKQDTIVDLL